MDANEVMVSAKIPGRIQTLTVDEGQDVKAGQLIAIIESDDLQAARKAAEATAASQKWKLGETVETERQNRGETGSATVNAEAQVRAARGLAGPGPGQLEHQQADTSRTVALAEQGIMSAQAATKRSPACRPPRPPWKRPARMLPRPKPRCARRAPMNCSPTVAARTVDATRDQVRECPRAGRQAKVRDGLRAGFRAGQRQGERARRAAGRSGGGGRADRHHHGPDPDLGLRAAARDAGRQPCNWATALRVVMP